MTAHAIPFAPKNSTTVRPNMEGALRLRAIRGGLRVLSRVSPEGAAAVVERLLLTPRRHARPASEFDILAKATARSLPSEDGALAAWEWAPIDSARELVERSTREAPRVLLVHGWEGRGAQLGSLVAPLTESGFRVFAFDAPGHGDSPGERSSLFQIAAAIAQAADHFGPLQAIVAHSMGGASTLWASRRGELASRFVTIAAPVNFRDFTGAYMTTLGFSEDIRSRVHRRLSRRFGVRIDDVRADRPASDTRRRLLVVHDEADREVPVSCGEAIARAWPEAEFRRTRGFGHRRILKDDATIRAIVRFIAPR